jgi:hypothetical protein
MAMRVGIHAGGIEYDDGIISGITVNTGARILEVAQRLSGASSGPDGHGLRKRRARAASFSEALDDCLPIRVTRDLERDSPVQTDPVELDVGHGALRPALVREVLLRRIRADASAKRDGKAARPDGPEGWSQPGRKGG